MYSKVEGWGFDVWSAELREHLCPLVHEFSLPHDDIWSPGTNKGIIHTIPHSSLPALGIWMRLVDAFGDRSGYLAI